MDVELRKLEREAAQGDQQALERLLRKRVGMGEGKMQTKFKLKYGKKYFSNTGGTIWVNAGTRFGSKAAALNALEQKLEWAERNRKASYHRYRVKALSLLNTPMDEISLVEINTYVIEKDCPINIADERTKNELAKIRREKEKIEREEQRLLAEVNKKRKALLQKEIKLQKATGKK